MTDAATPAAELLARLIARGWSVGIAESLTGGAVVSELVSVPGASAVVRGGIVAYATELKHALLGVEAPLLASEGPVHPLVATQMAQGVRAITGADVGIATTGVAGPEPQGGRPVGTVYIAVTSPEGAWVEAHSFEGDRSQIRAASVLAALRLAISSV